MIIDITSKIPLKNYSKNRIHKNTGKIYKPAAIVLHITGDSNEHQTISWFKNPISEVSAHYVIEKNGKTYMCVHPNDKAYHAGLVNEPIAKIYYNKFEVNPNLYTIGVECVSSGESLSKLQYISLIKLLNDLCSTYNIPKNKYYIIGHNELDIINRQFDPISSYKVDNIIKLMKGVYKMFKDECQISEYAKPSVYKLYEYGIVKGDDMKKFNPKDFISREDMAVVLDNFLQVIEKKYLKPL